MKLQNLIHVLLGIFCFALSPVALAVSPPPDGGYPGFNTAEGQAALFSLTTGTGNVAVGWGSLYSDTEGSLNTAIGTGALLFNTADQNTATGAGALLFNNSGTYNTANGAFALHTNTTGSDNTANGHRALYGNVSGQDNTGTGFNVLYNNDGDQNTASGSQALYLNTDGSDNTAIGFKALYSDNADENTAIGSQALFSNTTGSNNTAIGFQALFTNTMGNANTASGFAALFSNTMGDSNNATGYTALTSNTTGIQNNAFGYSALLLNVTGDNNTAMGDTAGAMITGSGNVCIGEGVQGLAAVDNTTWIRNVYDSVASDRAVYVNSDNKIGTLASSRRYKEEIKPMDKTSEALLRLKPVTFRYKQELDHHQVPMFGLIAEDVENVNPDLVTRNKKGQVETVRYDAVNAMLLNEFLKEHRTVQELKSVVANQQAAAAEQQKQIEALTAGLQKVSAQLELSKSVPHTVLNNE
jgi:trimeric autotransporter adhesin